MFDTAYKIHNACTEPCDTWDGPCVCGATHNLSEWSWMPENVTFRMKMLGKPILLIKTKGFLFRYGRIVDPCVCHNKAEVE